MGVWHIGDLEVKLGEEQGPVDLPLVQAAQGLQMFQILVISKDLDQVVGFLQVVSPDLKCHLDGQ